MKMRKWIVVLICALMFMSIFPVTVSADTVPKPSVRITFENLGDELCYGTLLSSKESTGPSSAWNGDPEYALHNENPNGYYSYLSYGYDVWKAFVDFAEKDDFYFLQEVWQVNETKQLAWTYYPPSEFKILLYFPNTGEFAVSDVYKRYAFDSYFTVNMDDAILIVDYNEELSTNQRLSAYKSYNYAAEIAALAARIAITIVIEIVIALAFGYWEKKQLLLITKLNGGTQIVLNVLLNIINYRSGQLAFVLFYILFEIIVVIIEAVIMFIFVNRISLNEKRRWQIALYVLIANAASFWAGLYLAERLPELF